MNTYVYCTCPECGFTNKVSIELLRERMQQLVTCNLEDGGCDKTFVISVEVKTSVVVSRIVEEKKS